MNPLCAYCQRPGVLHRDHVVPRSRGGPDNATNIVMACQSCNAAKHDRLASEWLGDRCPPAVLEIESQVNEKLRKRFKKRDKQPAKTETLYAIHFGPDGGVHYVGQVVSESQGTIRMEIAEGLPLMGGVWWPSGELADVPAKECRLFNDRAACISTANEICEERIERRGMAGLYLGTYRL